jgi:hypothetical protein
MPVPLAEAAVDSVGPLLSLAVALVGVFDPPDSESADLGPSPHPTATIVAVSQHEKLPLMPSGHGASAGQ